MYTLSIFIDPKKAFDTVSHTIRETWFRSYLTDRYQYMSISNIEPEKKKILCGLPKGGILVPQLFLYVINNMFEHLIFSNCILFADEMTIFIIGKSLRFLKLKIQCDLDKIAFWLLENGLSLNITKTKSMLITPKSTIHFESIDLKTEW